MKERVWGCMAALLLTLAMSVSLLAGCAGRTAEDEEEPIQVYLWTANLYEKYAPYVQAQLPDVDVEFVVGNNDLNFYKFLNENGELPDVITCCRFSLHDAQPLKDSLMDLSTSNEAGTVYNTYLNSFMNEDGSINWLPVCADAHGFVVNRGLFEQYEIPLPTDYDSFISACRAFEAVGLRGFTADYSYDYTCMETLQGLSATALSSSAGRKWRTAYSDPANTERVGLDDTVWPGAFERMEQFIRDVHLTAEDLNNNYDTVTELFQNGQLAMYFGSSAGVSLFREAGIDTVFLPFFGENAEKWLMVSLAGTASVLRWDVSTWHEGAEGDAVGGGPEHRLQWAGHAELQSECAPSLYGRTAGGAAGGGGEPHVYPHRLQRFLFRFAGRGLQDDRGEVQRGAGV